MSKSNIQYQDKNENVYLRGLKATYVVTYIAPLSSKSLIVGGIDASTRIRISGLR